MASVTPPIRTMTDFVVFVFLMIVLAGLVSGWSVVVVLYATDRNPDALMNSLLDITTTIIGALVGFVAGKGQGRAEVHEERQAHKTEQSP